MLFDIKNHLVEKDERKTATPPYYFDDSEQKAYAVILRFNTALIKRRLWLSKVQQYKFCEKQMST